MNIKTLVDQLYFFNNKKPSFETEDSFFDNIGQYRLLVQLLVHHDKYSIIKIEFYKIKESKCTLNIGQLKYPYTNDDYIFANRFELKIYNNERYKVVYYQDYLNMKVVKISKDNEIKLNNLFINYSQKYLTNKNNLS